MRLLQLRRDVAGRVFNIQDQLAQKEIHQGELMEWEEKRAGHPVDYKLTEAQKRKLSGQIHKAQANIHYIDEQVGIWLLELQALHALLAAEN
jgi:hypothetical protein